MNLIKPSPRGALLGVALLFSCLAHGAELKTADGLRLRVADNGNIESVNAGGRVITSKGGGGIFVRGAGADKFVPMHGACVASAGRVQVYSKSEPLLLDVVAEFQSRGDYIACEGTVMALDAKERCVDVKVQIPVDARGWRWGSGLMGEDVIKKSAAGTRTSDHITMYPVASISETNGGVGLAMAVPPNHPTLFETGANEEGLFVIFKIGLSPDTNPANQTKFRVIIYQHDRQWGFRSALDRYYGFYRDPYFIRRVKKIGAWAWHNPPPAAVQNARLYAFHEAGGEIWKTKDEGMHGYEHEGVNLAKTVGDMERLGRFAEDEGFGIYTLPYTIVGQRQVYHLPTLPGTRDDAIKAFDKWTTDKPIVFQCPGPSIGFRSVDQLKEIIRSSSVYDPDQKPEVLLRQYLGNTISFPLNPNPNLYSDKDVMTIARYTLDDYLPMLFTGSKYIDGCYVDSLGRWPSYYNFRRDHFKYSTVPLTYSTGNKPVADADEADGGGKIEDSINSVTASMPKPCLWNLQSHAEYLWQLSSRLHAQKKIVFANGVHPNRVMLGFAVDALGSEGVPTYKSGEGFYSTRVAAYQKPYCALNGRDGTSAASWNSCLFLGILVGARSEAGQDLERKYLPSIIRMNELGWEPVTYARSDNASIGVERWGKAGNVVLTVMNRSKQSVAGGILIDYRALGLSKKAKARDLVSGDVVDLIGSDDVLVAGVSLDAEEARAIEFK